MKIFGRGVHGSVRFSFWVKSKPKPKCRFSGFKNRSVSVFFGFGFSVFTSVRFGFSVISVFLEQNYVRFKK
ncbi:hypothetical protein HanXRQr2_Chr07g0314111 [Helianthus annuus]|uniref:Uncharacterized protein n=1 Tax=Helianthus annuus TaxID=4232 RepID=A0A9K3IPJ9_HELAN|nr:hypothetical protein HanXRQr2_Chr07g0314111 [Helianthus annuus]KAJ0906277.1 hypothetical protein HanPSC8_Chr07g0303701 [Helianthus annuus]